MAAPSRASVLLCIVALLGISCDKANPGNTEAPLALLVLSDVTPPAQVMNLSVTANPVTVATFTWTAVGDDGYSGTAAGYELRRSGGVITDANWASASVVNAVLPFPSPSGSAEVATLGGIDRSVENHYALKVFDEIGNYSAASNDVVLPALDVTPPARVGNLAIYSVSGESVTFSWIAVGDDGLFGGIAANYELRRSRHEISDANWESAEVVSVPMPFPSSPGQTEVVTVPLNRSVPNHWALKVADESGNWSPVSSDVHLLIPVRNNPTRTQQ